MEKYHHGDLKNSILDAAINIISEKGVDSLSIRATAKETGVSHAAPYRHFKNREELIVSIAVRGFEILWVKLSGINQKKVSPIELLHETSRTFINFAVENRELYRLMFGNYILNKTDHTDFFNAYNRIFKRLQNLIIRYNDHSGLKKSTSEVSVTAVSVFSLIHGYIMLVIDNKEDKNVGSKAQTELIIKKTEALLSL